MVDETSVNVLDELSNFIFTSKYARYNEERGRRETWDESVSRVESMHLNHYKSFGKEVRDEIKSAFDFVRSNKVVPSMRSMQFGGPAIEAHNARIFNCSVRHVDSTRSFSEIFYLLLCGCGVGIGLYKTFLNRLPDLVSKLDKTGTVLTYVIEDTIEGWADSIEALLCCYFKNTPWTGRKIIFDYSKIRKKGSILKTGGGKAPGYKGLKASHTKIKALLDHIIEDMRLIRLRSIDAYDIVMHCSDAVLSGGIRRSACSVVFDIDDEYMMNAKTFFTVQKHKRFSKDDETGKWYGQVIVNKKTYDVELYQFDYEQVINHKKISWFYIEPQRARSNNSVLLMRDEVTKEQFEHIVSKTREFGEPGFVFGSHKYQLYNPCFEVGFVPVTELGECGVQFCNLSSINGALVKTIDDFKAATKAATIIGTLQAGFTHFPYLHHVSKYLTEREALLGVSITGMMDNPDILLNPEYQKMCAEYAIQVNREFAIKIGVNPAARITCIKPEGTTSLKLKSASGIHPHHARKYIRRVQCNKIDNVYKHFKKINSHACDESVWSANKTDDVVSFPIEVSDNVMIKSDLTAFSHLEYIKSSQQNWVITGTTSVNTLPIHHNVSCTVIVDNNEWADVIEYLFKNKDYFAAVSLLPKSGDKEYTQAPLESIVSDEDLIKFNELKKSFRPVDYSLLKETEDKTELVATAACAGGACEIIY